MPPGHLAASYVWVTQDERLMARRGSSFGSQTRVLSSLAQGPGQRTGLPFCGGVPRQDISLPPPHDPDPLKQLLVC